MKFIGRGGGRRRGGGNRGRSEVVKERYEQEMMADPEHSALH